MHGSFNYKCYACKGEHEIPWDDLSKSETIKCSHDVTCPSCGAVGAYWNDQLNVSNYNAPKPPDFCVCIVSYDSARLQKFLINFEKFSMGVDADVYFVHNAFEVEGTINRGQPRTQEQTNEIRELIQSCKIKNKTLIERDNIGEDIGAQQFIFGLLKHRYKYFFFINEGALILRDGWLRPFWDMYENNRRVIACGPKVFKKLKPWGGEKFRWVIATTYWSLRGSFGKDKLVWPPPQNRAQTKAQEMQLIYPQAHDEGYCIGQVGNGADLMHMDNLTTDPSAYLGDGGIVC